MLNYRKLWLTAIVLLCGFYAFPQELDLNTVKSYLNENKTKYELQQQDFAELFVTAAYTEQGSPIKRVYTQQRVAGIDVVGGIFSLHVNLKTGVQHGTNNLYPLHKYAIGNPQPIATPQYAAKTVLQELGADVSTLSVKEAFNSPDRKTIFKRGESKLWDVPVRLAYLLDKRTNKLNLVWEVQFYEYNKQHYWLAYVEDKTGKVVRKADLVLKCSFGSGAETDANVEKRTHNHELAMNNFIDTYSQPVFANNIQKKFFNTTAGANNQYRVYDMPYESPSDPGVTHSLVTNTGDTVGSVDGWHRVGNASTYNYTRGNNVIAFYDPSPGPLGGTPPNPASAVLNNGGPAGTPTAAEPFIFDYPVNLNAEPSTYRSAAIVNLFYWNNLMHDVFYRFGFTEDAANFQASHTFSTGTKGNRPQGQNDEVWAQAQDGGGTNNANMLTLADGTNGQMQMYLWTPSAPDSVVQITSSTNGNPPNGKKYYAIPAAFNTTFPQNLHTNPVLNKQFVIVQKNALSTVGTSSQGCATGQQSIFLPPANDVNDKIVLIDRGNCSFVEKVKGAEAGGAAGVIVINNVPGPPLTMGGSDAPGQTVNIPAVMVAQDVGEYLKAQITAGATIIGSLKQDNPTLPMRDGDFDNAVIAHEYGHGISNRLTGGPGSLLPLGGDEQGGEGWSDFMGLYMITRSNDLVSDPAYPNGKLPLKGIGTYVTYQNPHGAGIRPTPYSIDKTFNPSMFKDIGKGGEITIPHGVGYIWCTMLYELEQELINQYGFNDNVYFSANPHPTTQLPVSGSGGNNVAMRLVMEGMKLQPLSPTFEQQRDAIIAADNLLYNGAHNCKIWKAFAKRGLGASAKSNSNSVGDEQQATDMPLTCDPTQKKINVYVTGIERMNNNSQITYTVRVKNLMNVAQSNVFVVDSIPTGTSVASVTGGGTFSNGKVTWNIPSLTANGTMDFTLVLNVALPSATTQIFYDDHEGTTNNWTASPYVVTWTKVTDAARAYSGSKVWYAQEREDPAYNVTLTTANPIAIPAQGASIMFYHKFNTEAEFDGGVLETSTDGVQWTYLPGSVFTKNPYNSVISNLDNPNIGTTALPAYSGATLGYISSVAGLNAFAGQQLRLRFRYTCDVATLSSGANPGWHIDDIYFVRNLTTITNYVWGGIPGGDNVYDSTGNTPTASYETIVFDPTPLPVQLSSLTAKAEKQTIKLGWKTYTEINNAGFEIERKAENGRDFVKVGFVQGAGNSTNERSYSFTDVNVKPGVYYHYRLKQIDANGRVTYSNVAIAKLGADNTIVFDIMPNPTKGSAFFTVSTPGIKDGVLKMYDLMGKQIATLNVSSAYNGLQRFEVPVSNLAAGVYWVELIAGDTRETKRLVINK